jgi:hypothetical protein
MNEEIITIEEIFEHQTFGDVYQTIEVYRKQFPKPPVRPAHPNLNPKSRSSMSSNELRELADVMDSHELLMTDYHVKLKEYDVIETEFNDDIDFFIKKQSGLFEKVPEQYQGNVAYKAWERGHSGGYYEYYQVLLDLIEIFE